jgi:hypothetical protein
MTNHTLFKITFFSSFIIIVVYTLSHKPLISVQHNIYIIVRQSYSITLGYKYSPPSLYLSIPHLSPSLSIDNCYYTFSSFLRMIIMLAGFVKLAMYVIARICSILHHRQDKSLLLLLLTFWKLTCCVFVSPYEYNYCQH